MASKKELERKLRQLETAYAKLQESFAGLEQNLVQKVLQQTVSQLSQERDPLKKEVLKRFKKKRKDVIKAKISELLGARSVELAELKDLIVDGLGYCSKASFYRYVSEMKKKAIIRIAEVESRQIVSLSLEKVVM